MKTYEFVVGASQDRYGTCYVEADTLEEAKEKFFADKMHETVDMPDCGEIEDHRIVTACEINGETGEAVPDGESEDQVKIPGLPLSNFERGLAFGRQDVADVEKQLKLLSSEIRSMHASVARAKLSTHVALLALRTVRDKVSLGGLREEISHAIKVIVDAVQGEDHALRLMLSVSTRHISQETNDLFCEAPVHEWPILGAEVEDISGFIFHVPDDDYAPDGTPKDLWNVLQFARNQYGCDYAMICAEGVVHDGFLPQYDWN